MPCCQELHGFIFIQKYWFCRDHYKGGLVVCLFSLCGPQSATLPTLAFHYDKGKLLFPNNGQKTLRSNDSARAK